MRVYHINQCEYPPGNIVVEMGMRLPKICSFNKRQTWTLARDLNAHRIGTSPRKHDHKRRCIWTYQFSILVLRSRSVLRSVRRVGQNAASNSKSRFLKFWMCEAGRDQFLSLVLSVTMSVGQSVCWSVGPCHQDHDFWSTVWKSLVCEWMNEWMNKWMNERMNEWMNEWINDEWIDEWMNWWMSWAESVARGSNDVFRERTDE